MGYADLLPMELQEELIQLSEAQTRIEFRVGDVVTAAQLWNHQNQRPTSVMEIYSAVGVFCGKASRTVRDYHAVASFYPPDVREEYTVLKFSHFREAMTLGANWEKALQWAVEQVDTLGRPASVDAMIAEFSVFDDAGAETDMEYEEAEAEGPGETPLAGFARGLQTMRMYLPMINLNPAEKEQAEEALEVLQEVTSTIKE